MDNRIERLSQLVPKEHKEEAREQIIAILETARDEAFLDGYRYAIEVLNDGLMGRGK